MLFLFNLIYAATWGTVAFLIQTEIFPSEMRAQGNRFGITSLGDWRRLDCSGQPHHVCAPRVQDLLSVCGLELALDAYSVLLLPRDSPSIVGVY